MRARQSEHQRLSEAEPQARAWQQQEQRGDLLPARLVQPSPSPAAGYERVRVRHGFAHHRYRGTGASCDACISLMCAPSQQRTKLRSQFNDVRKYLDLNGVPINRELQLDIQV